MALDPDLIVPWLVCIRFSAAFVQHDSVPLWWRHCHFYIPFRPTVAPRPFAPAESSDQAPVI